MTDAALPATATAAPPPPPAILSDVFGASRRIPLTYCDRPRIDAELRYYLSQGRHLIVYGGSNQGKSSLVRKHLASNSYIEVECAPSMRRYDLYRLLLREAGVFVSLGRKKKRTKGVSAEVTLLREESGSESETSEQTVSIDLSNINDILKLLSDNEFAKTIVIDDFHLLPGKVQRQIAADLKTLYERSDRQVIVIGVWREDDKLSLLSGYLPGRSNSINVDAWSKDELKNVVQRGGELLHVTFGPELSDRIVEVSIGNVGVLQQICQRVCQLAGIAWAQEKPVTIADPALADRAFAMLVESTAGRYRLFIERYARRKSWRDGPHIRKWIMHAILSQGAAKLDEGLTAVEVIDHINRHHTGFDENSYGEPAVRQPYRGRIEPADVLKPLSKIERYQRRKDINPVILSYDKRREALRAVDVGFLLFLKSLNNDDLVKRLPRYENELDEAGIAALVAQPPAVQEEAAAATPAAAVAAPEVSEPAVEAADAAPVRKRRRTVRRRTRAKGRTKS
jgi:hypothetical protein